MTKEKPTLQSRITRHVPPRWLLAAVVVMWLLHVWVPVAQAFPPSALWVGRSLVIVGFAIIYYCVRLFRKAETPLRPFEPVTKMIMDGPFRFSRNPVYVAMFILLAGWAIALGSVSPWLPVAAFMYAIRTYWVLPEEAQMEREVGVPYLEYKKRVRRWL